MEQQKPTLPVIRGLQIASPEQRDRLLGVLQSENRTQRAELLPLLISLDAVNYAQQRAHDHLQRARDQLQLLPESPMRDHLFEVSGFVLSRSE